MLATRLAALLLLAWTSLAVAANVKALTPNILAVGQVIYPGAPVVYALETVPGQAYEVKLSYRATTPSFFKLRIVDDDEAERQRSHGAMRRMLNTEKTFVTGGVEGRAQYVEVTMQVEGVSYRLSADELARRATTFDILLEELVVGIPVSALTLIGVALALLSFMMLCVYPRVSALVHDADSMPSKTR
ncbi:hypothetical protein SPRG_08758 [Saprolegnia parasitica CBS 223.65]|uniref:GOLD domain-containing protein n=1 Tax=Saprolegnia parasitica (strain CBS 223.65) TaxID=695850 RepID=A0A067C9H5_SAPPC|nr:hypothetical protein SPRG_08758 [Saprolegnia parasitica CBS 223.65]KDO25815.1 hypothetical protein SPRG_08758 [Saprolegnia parasitica CBS 223.65]|eukprot:XP_012203380.1 hypothetical protein SPRG_08758 [Saprolegnia parasitica CBS 223.65]